jgi:mono/diheme cytochrome c family protein
MKKIILTVVFSVFVAFAFLLSYVKIALPNVGDAPDLKVELTPERIERGKYLANSVAVCMDCHSTRDWTKFSGPITPGTLGKGGEAFDQKAGFPGAYYASNITPHNLGKWTDGEIFRAVSSGVSKDGRALFPVMPHPNYGKLDKEDILSIIAYIRTLPTIVNEVPAPSSDFPMNFILNTIPQKAQLKPRPDTANQVLYGKYVFTAASCGDCHTKQEKGKPIEGMELAGGFEFPMRNGNIVKSANITPDEETGIGLWTKNAFVKKFKAYAAADYKPHTVAGKDFNTVMPWTMYGTMTEQDLGAIYEYLRTVKPIKNRIDNLR